MVSSIFVWWISTPSLAKMIPSWPLVYMEQHPFLIRTKGSDLLASESTSQAGLGQAVTTTDRKFFLGNHFLERYGLLSWGVNNCMQLAVRASFWGNFWAMPAREREWGVYSSHQPTCWSTNCWRWPGPNNKGARILEVIQQSRRPGGWKLEGEKYVSCQTFIRAVDMVWSQTGSLEREELYTTPHFLGVWGDEK